MTLMENLEKYLSLAGFELLDDHAWQRKNESSNLIVDFINIGGDKHVQIWHGDAKINHLYFRVAMPNDLPPIDPSSFVSTMDKQINDAAFSQVWAKRTGESFSDTRQTHTLDPRQSKPL